MHARCLFLWTDLSEVPVFQIAALRNFCIVFKERLRSPQQDKKSAFVVALFLSDALADGFRDVFIKCHTSFKTVTVRPLLLSLSEINADLRSALTNIAFSTDIVTFGCFWPHCIWIGQFSTVHSFVAPKQTGRVSAIKNVMPLAKAGSASLKRKPAQLFDHLTYGGNRSCCLHYWRYYVMRVVIMWLRTTSKTLRLEIWVCI